MDSVQEQVQEVFREVFDDATLVLRDDMTADDIEAWDSLGLVNLIVALEDTFDIKFAATEISEMQSVGAILTIIQGKVPE